MTQAEKASRLNMRALKALRHSREQVEEARDAGRDVLNNLSKAEEQLKKMEKCLREAETATHVRSYRSISCTFAFCPIYC